MYIFSWCLRTVQLTGKRQACSLLGLSLGVNFCESPGKDAEGFEISAVGTGIFFFIHLWTGLWLPLSGNCSSFLTVQEGPLKILTSNKQTASPCAGQGGHISPRGQETHSSELSPRFVFTGYLLFQIWRLTQNLSSQIWVGSVQ